MFYGTPGGWCGGHVRGESGLMREFRLWPDGSALVGRSLSHRDRTSRYKRSISRLIVFCSRQVRRQWWIDISLFAWITFVWNHMGACVYLRGTVARNVPVNVSIPYTPHKPSMGGAQGTRHITPRLPAVCLEEPSPSDVECFHLLCVASRFWWVIDGKLVASISDTFLTPGLRQWALPINAGMMH